MPVIGTAARSAAPAPSAPPPSSRHPSPSLRWRRRGKGHRSNAVTSAGEPTTGQHKQLAEILLEASTRTHLGLRNAHPCDIICFFDARLTSGKREAQHQRKIKSASFPALVAVRVVKPLVDRPVGHRRRRSREGAQQKEQVRWLLDAESGAPDPSCPSLCGGGRLPYGWRGPFAQQCASFARASARQSCTQRRGGGERPERDDHGQVIHGACRCERSARQHDSNKDSLPPNACPAVRACAQTRRRCDSAARRPLRERRAESGELGMGAARGPAGSQQPKQRHVGAVAGAAPPSQAASELLGAALLRRLRVRLRAAARRSACETTTLAG
eukprot:gene9865-biopygen11506